MEPLELHLGTRILRLDGRMIEICARVFPETLRIHVNYAGAKLEPKRNGRVLVTIGWPPGYVHGMTDGPGDDLLWDEVQTDGRSRFDVDPTLEQPIRTFLAAAASRRTLPLAGAATP
jgi:hypothetical protein